MHDHDTIQNKCNQLREMLQSRNLLKILTPNYINIGVDQSDRVPKPRARSFACFDNFGPFELHVWALLRAT